MVVALVVAGFSLLSGWRVEWRSLVSVFDWRFGFVERWFARVWSRWPLMRAADEGGCLRTWADVRSGQVDKRLLSMALHQVDRAGEKRVAW